MHYLRNRIRRKNKNNKSNKSIEIKNIYKIYKLIINFCIWKNTICESNYKNLQILHETISLFFMFLSVLIILSSKNLFLIIENSFFNFT